MSGSDATRYSDLAVLVVEDNDVNQKVTAAMLQHFDISSDIAENGQVAIEFVADKKYDLIFMDCQMPVKNGIETTKYIRDFKHNQKACFKTAYDVTIIAMTANVAPNDIAECVECGMDDFIAKPVELDVIGFMLEKWFF